MGKHFIVFSLNLNVAWLCLIISNLSHLYFYYSGCNVINVNLGNTKYVLFLMVEEMMAKQNILALIAVWRR